MGVGVMMGYFLTKTWESSMTQRIMCFLVVCLLLGIDSARAAVVFSQSGTGVHGRIAAKAQFDFVQHDFGLGNVDAVQITLTNIADATQGRSDLLTGFFFSLNGDVGPLTTTSEGFDALAATVRTSNTSSIFNVDLGPAINTASTDGMYQLNNLYLQTDKTANSEADYSAFEYGIATVAYGLGGFKGNHVDGDNYGIAAPGSNLALTPLKTALPVVDAQAVFWMMRPSEWTSLDQIHKQVCFTFGSKPDSAITTTVVPEPATLTLWSLLGGLGIAACWRRRRKKVASRRS